MKILTSALALGSMLVVAVSIEGGCGSSSSLADGGSNTGSAGTSSMDAGGMAGTGNAGSSGSGGGGTGAGSTGSGGGGAAGANDTIPEGWTGAQALTIQQSNCPSGGSFPPQFEAVADASGSVAGTLKCAEFRLGQTLCVLVIDNAATTRVLVQPCDLHPNPQSVPAGVQSFNVAFTLPARADRTSLEMYERADFYGAQTPPVPMLLATAPVGTGSDGGSSTDASADGQGN